MDCYRSRTADHGRCVFHVNKNSSHGYVCGGGACTRTRKATGACVVCPPFVANRALHRPGRAVGSVGTAGAGAGAGGRTTGRATRGGTGHPASRRDAVAVGPWGPARRSGARLGSAPLPRGRRAWRTASGRWGAHHTTRSHGAALRCPPPTFPRHLPSPPRALYSNRAPASPASPRPRIATAPYRQISEAERAQSPQVLLAPTFPPSTTTTESRETDTPANPGERASEPSRPRHGLPGGLLGAGAPEAAAPPPPPAGVHPALPPLGVPRRGPRRPAGSRGRPPGAAAGPPPRRRRRAAAGAGPRRAGAGAGAAAPPAGVPRGAGDGHRGGAPRGALRRAGGLRRRRLRGLPQRHRRRRRGAPAQQLPPRLPPGMPGPLDGARPAHLPALPRAAHPRRDGRRTSTSPTPTSPRPRRLPRRCCGRTSCCSAAWAATSESNP